MGLSEEEFYEIAIKHIVSPWSFNKEEITNGKKTNDFDNGTKEKAYPNQKSKDQIKMWSSCSTCNSTKECF